MKEIKQRIIELLRDTLPLSLMADVDEMESLMKQGKNRQVC